MGKIRKAIVAAIVAGVGAGVSAGIEAWPNGIDDGEMAVILGVVVSIGFAAGAAVWRVPNKSE